MANVLNAPAKRRRSLFRSVTLVTFGEAGTTSTPLHKQKRRRRTSKRWRPFERMLRRVSTAQATAAGEYLGRHQRSSRRKRNGWLKDLGKNASKAGRRGFKKLKFRILS